MHGDGKAYRIDGTSKVQNWIKIKVPLSIFFRIWTIKSKKKLF